MKIGIVTTWFERGAAYVSRQFEKVIGEKHQMFIYARGGEKYARNDPEWDHPNVYWSRRYRLVDSYIDRKEFVRWLTENAIDAVIFNEQRYFEPLLWCKDLNVKSIAYIDYYTEEMLPLFDAYDALICNTRRHCSAFEEFEHVFYIPWGTDVDLYKPSKLEGSLVEQNRVTFFNSAGVSPQRKGTDTFLKALNKCKVHPNIKAIIHSQVNLKKCLPHLAETIDRLVESGKLEIVEKTIPAPGLYHRADVYVYPSVLDGIGLTVPEAISSGLACIVSDNPPMNEFVQPEFGSLIPITRLYARSDGYYWPQCKCDVDALSEMMVHLADVPQNVVEMKNNARRYAVEKLSFAKNASGIFELLEKIRVRTISDELREQIKSFDRKGKNGMMLRINQSKVLLLIYESMKNIQKLSGNNK